jgi:hypothetical protein
MRIRHYSRTAVLMGVLACALAHATTYPLPGRPMTDREVLDRATRATAIARVHIVALHTAVEESQPPGIDVEFLRVFKGDLPVMARVGLPISPVPGVRLDELRGRVGQEAIALFHSRNGELELVGNRFLPNGMHAVTDANRDSLDAEYGEAVRRNSLVAMARNADLVVRGEANFDREADVLQLSVREHIGGALKPGLVQLDPLFPLLSAPDAIFILERVSSGAYRPIHADNGILEIESGVVKRLEQPVDSVIRQIRMARLGAPTATVADGP